MSRLHDWAFDLVLAASWNFVTDCCPSGENTSGTARELAKKTAESIRQGEAVNDAELVIDGGIVEPEIGRNIDAQSPARFGSGIAQPERGCAMDPEFRSAKEARSGPLR